MELKPFSYLKIILKIVLWVNGRKIENFLQNGGDPKIQKRWIKAVFSTDLIHLDLFEASFVPAPWS